MEKVDHKKMLVETLKEMGLSSYGNIKNFISKVLNYGDDDADEIINILKDENLLIIKN